MRTARAVVLAIVATLALAGGMSATVDAKTAAQAAVATVNDDGGPADGAGSNDQGDPGFPPPDP